MDLIKKELEKLNIDLLNGRHIMLAGRMEHVLIMKNELEKQGFQVSRILDNDHKKQGIVIDHVLVEAPEDVLLPFNPKIVILIYSPKYWEEMMLQFESLGYQEEKQVFVLDRPSEKKNKQLVVKGYKLYCRLKKKFGNHSVFLLANCPLGDFYLLSLYLTQYIKEHEIGNYVVIGESGGIEKLASDFGIQNTQRLTTEESNQLIRTWIFLGENRVKIKPLTIWQGGFRFNPCLCRQKKGFTFMDTFSQFIFGLGKNAQPSFPQKKVYGIAEDFFKKHNLKRGKTIILSPYAYSLQSFSQDFWIELSYQLKKLEYTVAVNVDDSREYNCIPDTTTIQLPLLQMIDALELAGLVIGIRSGFFDITSQAVCRRIVLYPASVKNSRVTWNSTDINFCSLKSMGLCNDAVEIEAAEESDLIDRLIHEVRGYTEI